MYSPWLWLVLIVGTCALGCLTVALTWSVFDEGFVAKGGELVLRGKLLIRDFLTLYGPAQFYILAGLFWVFGVQLLVLRLWGVLVVGLLLLGVYLVAARVSGNSRRCGGFAMAGSLLLFLYQLPPSGYPMVPATALILAAALPLHHFAVTGHRRALVLTSFLIGCAALFRWDQGIFGLAALAVALAFWLASKNEPPWAVIRVAACAFLPALGLMVFVYAPLLVTAGIDYFIQDVLVHSVRDFKDYRGIDFVRPQIWRMFRSLERGQPGIFLLQSIPLVAMGLACAAIAATMVRALVTLRPKSTGYRRTDAGALTTSVFVSLAVLGLMNQMRIRPDVSRSVLVAAAATPLFAYWWHICISGGRTWVQTAAIWMVAMAIAILAAGASNATYDLVQSRRLVATESPYSRFMRNPVHVDEYNALIAYVRAQTQPGELIFSGVTDHQVLFVNDVMLYFLTGRDGPTRFYEMDPGLANTREAQNEMVAALEKAGVRLLVLWDLKSTENNLSSRPNGIDTLDRYIREKYTMSHTFGPYQVWMRR